METFSDEESLSDLDEGQPLIGLGRGKGPPSSDEEEEVYGLLSSGDESSGNDEANEITEDMRSDVEDEEKKADLPDSRAWGRKRKNFYDADYVDTNIFRKDPEAAKLEEEEARDIQERLAEQLDAGMSFSLEMLSLLQGPAAEVETQLEKQPAEVVDVDEKIVTDLSKLSKRQRLDLIKKESPEFFGLIRDFKEKMAEVTDKWKPMMDLISEGKVKSPLVEQLVHSNYELILNYCVHIGFYLLLKSKRIPVRTHPVIKRLCQLQELLKSLSVASESLSYLVNDILKTASERQKEFSEVFYEDKISTRDAFKTKKLLGVLEKRGDMENLSEGEAELHAGLSAPVGRKPIEEKKLKVMSLLNGRASSKRVTFEDGEGAVNVNDEDGDLEIVGAAGDEMEEDGDGALDGEKRAITYQMAKNKGLTPRRKKEMRNPRVKHRNRFRKAKIRRKGQVRDVLSETHRYGGEISGIKATVSKSIKIK